MDKMNTIGQRIRLSRINAGLSIKDLANKLNRDYSFVIKYETDKRNPSDKLLEKIGKVLKVSPLWLKYGDKTIIKDKYGVLKINYIKSNSKI